MPEGDETRGRIAHRSATAEVFLSYASQDAAAAAAIVEALEADGIACWIAPRDVTPGAFYADDIVHAIDAAKATVLVLSQHASASQHVLREVERTASKRHSLISIKMDNSSLPAAFEYFLNSSQWLDASDGNLGRSMARVIAAVRVVIQTPAIAPTFSSQLPQSASPRSPGSSRAPRRMAIAVTVLVGLGLVAFVAYRGWVSSRSTIATRVAATATGGHTAPSVPDKSVAVLPFVDMSEKQDQEYFSDGLAEELIDRLAHADNLKVIARTSSFQFKGKNEDMRTIGHRLGVANLLEGSVRRSGEHIRVTAQLISVADGTHRWSQTYDRKMGDIFKLQDEIAGAVAAALKSAMGASANTPPVSENTEAYNEILRGRYFRERSTEEDMKRSVEALRRAIAIDPDNATAWAELGTTFHRQGLYGWTQPKQAYEQARAALDKSLALNPNEALAHYELGVILRGYRHDMAGSRMHIRRAFELDAKLAAESLSDATDAYADGQSEVALREFQRHADLNPLDVNTLSWLAGSLLDAHRLPEAERTARNILEINPDFADAHCLLGYVFLEQGRLAESLAMMRQEPGENSRLICLADALWALGRHAEAEASMAQAQAKYGNSEAYGIAEYYARRRDVEKAFMWLNKAFENQEPPVQLIKGDGDLRILRNDPRFAELLKKLDGR